MASEIKVNLSLGFSKLGTADGLATGDLSFTLTGDKFLHGYQSIGTAEEALVLGEVTTGGWAIFRNRDATNYVSIRAASGATPLVRIRAGEAACFRIDAGATAPYLIANTAACLVEYLILVD